MSRKASPSDAAKQRASGPATDRPGKGEIVVFYDVHTERVRTSGRAASTGAARAPAQDPIEVLEQALRAGRQLRTMGDRLSMSPARLLAALTALARDTPAQADDSAGALSAHEEQLLRRAGSLREAMPALEKRASTRTALAGVRLLEDALTVREAARLLSVSESRVRQRLGARTMLGVEDAGGWRLPRFQFDGDGLLRGLDLVLPAFPPDVHPLAVKRLLEHPHPDLDLAGKAISPRDWLMSGGRPQPVVEIVAGAFALS